MEKTGRWSLAEILCVVSFLGAIVTANLGVLVFGQKALPFTAFILIPFDMVVRDVLHDRWRRKNRLWVNMAKLIVTGGLISFALEWEVYRIAIASCLGFLSAGYIDAMVYQRLIYKPRLVRMNCSNLASSIADSLVFPFIAFGWEMSLWLSATQAMSKFFGGAAWSLVFYRMLDRFIPRAIPPGGE